MTVEALAQRLVDTGLRHGEYEAVALPHDWVGLVRGLYGRSPGGLDADEAAAAAGRYMAEVERIVVTPA